MKHMCKVTAHFCDVSYFTYVKFCRFQKRNPPAKIIKIATSFGVKSFAPKRWVLEIGMITSVGSPLRRRSPQRETVKIVETKTPDLEVPRRCWRCIIWIIHELNNVNFQPFFFLNKHRSTSFLGRHLGAVCKCSCWVKPWSSSYLGKECRTAGSRKRSAMGSN